MGNHGEQTRPPAYAAGQEGTGHAVAAQDRGPASTPTTPTLGEAFEGIHGSWSRELEKSLYGVEVPCPECEGLGLVVPDGYEPPKPNTELVGPPLDPCPRCNGTGKDGAWVQDFEVFVPVRRGGLVERVSRRAAALAEAQEDGMGYTLNVDHFVIEALRQEMEPRG